MNALVALVISCRMKHSVIDKPVVISVNSLSHKEEIILRLSVKPLSLCMKSGSRQYATSSLIPSISKYSIQYFTQSKDNLQLHHFKVELYKVIIALPAFIPESVIPCIITIKINIKPITIW